MRQSRPGTTSLLGWDGVLPLSVAAVPYIVSVLLPRNDLAELSTAILVPIAAALVRTPIGTRQLQNLSGGELPWRRQLALAAAIVALLLFEASVAMLTFANDEPIKAWVFPAVLYLGYLTCIFFAFRPSASALGRR